MKFDRLQAAIANRADQQPTIYMALCMIEALFLDIEKAAGTELCQCPVGSEKLANKLVWLCKGIQEICKENDGELQSNRARLDELLRSIDVTRQELDTLSHTQTQLEASLAEYHTKIAAIEQQRSQAAVHLQAAQTQHDNLNQAVQALNEQNKELRQMMESREAEIRQHTLERDSTVDRLAAREKTVQALAEENSRLAGQLTACDAELAQLEETKDALTQAYDQLQDSRTELTMEIARKKDDADALRDKLAISQKKLDELRQERSDLQNRLNSQADELAQLQEQVSALKDTRLPELFQRIEQEKARRQELSDVQEQTAAEHDRLVAQIAALEAEAPGLQEQLGQVRAQYDVLSASSIASSNELQSLQEQIRDLTAQHSDAQQELLHSQLREKLRKLEQLAADCDRLTQENAARQSELAAAEAAVQDLRNIRQQLDVERETLHARQQEWNFAGYETYKKELAAVDRQLELLTTVWGNLEGSLAMIRTAVALPPLSRAGVTEDALAQTLRELRVHVNGLQKQLFACAQSVKLEELS